MAERPYFNLEELKRKAKHCTTHHHGCDCRELAWALYVESWKEENINLQSRIAELEAENKNLKERLELWRRFSKEQQHEIEYFMKVIMYHVQDKRMAPPIFDYTNKSKIMEALKAKGEWPEGINR